MPAALFANRRAGLIVAAAMLVAASACNRSSPSVDASLKADLQAAGGDVANGVSPQLVISPLEATPTASPTRAAPKRTPQASSKPTIRVADKPAINPTPAPAAATVTAPTPNVSAPTPSEPAPIAQPVRGQAQQQRGVYKTEGEIFRQMPWIRP